METFQKRGYKTYRADSYLSSDQSVNISVGRQYGLIFTALFIVALITFVYRFDEDQITLLECILNLDWDDIQTLITFTGIFIGGMIITSLTCFYTSNSKFLPKRLNTVRYFIIAIVLGFPFGWVMGIVLQEPINNPIENIESLCKGDTWYKPCMNCKVSRSSDRNFEETYYQISSINGYEYFGGISWGRLSMNSSKPIYHQYGERFQYYFDFISSYKDNHSYITHRFFKTNCFLLKIDDSQEWIQLRFSGAQHDGDYSYSFGQDLIKKLSNCDHFTIKIENPDNCYEFIFNGLNKAKL